MAARIRLVDEPLDSREFADLILAALRAAGFDVYRPDECAPCWVGESSVDEVEDLVHDKWRDGKTADCPLHQKVTPRRRVKGADTK